MGSQFISEEVKNIGFVSVRFFGTDGVSLETAKWAHVLKKKGLKCYYFAGQLDTPEDMSMLAPLADFKHPEIIDNYQACFSTKNRNREVTREIYSAKEKLKDALYEFIDKFKIQLLIPENALTIPLNIPLGIALTEVIAETGIQTIAHHHDFFWERKRFLVNCVWDYLNMSFPPHLGSMQHVTINSSGANQLALRTGVSSKLVPNVMDFDNPPPEPDEYGRDLRQVLGLEEDDIFILQPTRVVPRKGIEHAIELAHNLGPKAKIVVSHNAGDEGFQYHKRVLTYADTLNVKLIQIEEIANHERGTTPDGKKIYKLDDLYQHSDLVTYPSTFEGFGNAFLEACYFKKPLVVNNYSVYSVDIKSKGFKNIEFDDYITAETVEYTREVMKNPEKRQEMVEHNYDIARRYYSYSVLHDLLTDLLSNAFGKK